jgi:hypothetical protein
VTLFGGFLGVGLLGVGLVARSALVDGVDCVLLVYRET